MKNVNNNAIDMCSRMVPTAKISGFYVRQGMFETNGATALPTGVNFTVHTHYGTSCELLLFHNGEEEPYAVLPFPESFKIGDVYSMIVFGLDIEKFEYAYRIDGPYWPERGHILIRMRFFWIPTRKQL